MILIFFFFSLKPIKEHKIIDLFLLKSQIKIILRHIFFLTFVVVIGAFKLMDGSVCFPLLHPYWDFNVLPLYYQYQFLP